MLDKAAVDAVCVAIYGQRIWDSFGPMAKTNARDRVTPILRGALRAGVVTMADREVKA